MGLRKWRTIKVSGTLRHDALRSGKEESIKGRRNRGERFGEGWPKLARRGRVHQPLHIKPTAVADGAGRVFM